MNDKSIEICRVFGSEHIKWRHQGKTLDRGEPEYVEKELIVFIPGLNKYSKTNARKRMQCVHALLTPTPLHET